MKSEWKWNENEIRMKMKMKWKWNQNENENLRYFEIEAFEPLHQLRMKILDISNSSQNCENINGIISIFHTQSPIKIALRERLVISLQGLEHSYGLVHFKHR